MMEANREEGRYDLKIIKEMLSVFRLLCDSDESLNLRTVSSRAALSKTKTFKILSTLEGAGVLEKDQRGKYVMGPAAYGAAGRIMSKDPLLDRVKPLMERVALKTNEAVYFGKRDGERLVLLGMIECEQKIMTSSFVGRVLCESQDNAGQQQKFRGGIKVTEGLLDSEVSTVSQEITQFGRVVGALVVVAPTFRMPPAIVREKVVPALREATRHLTTAEGVPASRKRMAVSHLSASAV